MDAAKQLALVERNLTDEQIKTKAELLLKSKFLPSAIQTVEQALAIIMTGRELGLGLMESLRSINVIQGKPCLSAQLMLALCQRTGELVDMKVEEGNGYCSTTITRKGRSPHVYKFSMDDAKALGLGNKDNWIKQPKTMLRWRSLSGNLRVTFADAICGIYLEDEAEDATAHITQANERKEETAQEKKDELDLQLDTGEVHDALNEMEFIEKISNLPIVCPRFSKWYSEKTIGQIYGDKTPGGNPKGKKFLQDVALKSSVPEERAYIAKFIEILERQK